MMLRVIRPEVGEERNSVLRLAVLLKEQAGEERENVLRLGCSQGSPAWLPCKKEQTGEFKKNSPGWTCSPGRLRRILMISSHPRGSDEPLGFRRDSFAREIPAIKIRKYIIPMSPISQVNTVWNMGRFPIHRPAYALEMIDP